MAPVLIWAGKGGFLNLFNAAVLEPIPNAVNPILRRGRLRKPLGKPWGNRWVDRMEAGLGEAP
jgi:hypothetical protein